MRSFAEDMAELAETHSTRFFEQTRDRPGRTWYAADMTIDPNGDFMTGTLGYSSREQRRTFNERAWSWIKGEPHDVDAASHETVVPFALDLRETKRWAAFAPTNRIRPKTFADGFTRVLNQAVAHAGLIPTEWEVDLVASRAHVNEWLQVHSLVYVLRRTIKFSNPGRHLDDDRQEMRALAARRMSEEFKSSTKGILNISSQEFSNKLEGTETGDIEIYMRARGTHGAGDAIFRTTNSPDEGLIDDFAGDLMRGMEMVLAALRQYVADKP